MNRSLNGKDLICTQDWSVEELEHLLKLAKEMKAHRFSDRFTGILRHRTFLMFFYKVDDCIFIHSKAICSINIVFLASSNRNFIYSRNIKISVNPILVITIPTE